MRAYKVEFEGMENEFHHAATDAILIELGFSTAAELADIEIGTMLVKSTHGIPGGWDQYPAIYIKAHESEAYICNCCESEQPGDGFYDICKNCGWENEPGEIQHMFEDGGPNHMSLFVGRFNYSKYGHYKCKVGCGQVTCGCE